MKIKLIGSYVGAVVCGLVVLVAALLVMLQWGNTANFSFFGKNDGDFNTALLMLLCLAFGAVLPWLLKLLLACAMTIGHSRRDTAVIKRAATKAASKQAKPADQVSK